MIPNPLYKKNFRSTIFLFLFFSPFLWRGAWSEVSAQTITFNNTSTGPFGTIQTWTVPACNTSITIEVWGAQGGGGNTGPGGLGAYMKGTFSVTPGQTLKILVGQEGTQCSAEGGGGGGTFVTDMANNPLIIAGGGGGSSATSVGLGAVTGSCGLDGLAGGGAGGCAGNGGSGGSSSSSGGGLLTDGANDGNYPCTAVNGKGIAFINGGNGGYGTCCGAGANGGFGGGGGTHGQIIGGGGGGGYSGGGGGANGNDGGGGGGSYNAGTNQSNSDSINAGHGLVVITLSSLPLTLTASSTQTGCTTSTGTATATPAGGTPGYTYIWTGGQTTQTATGLGVGTYTVTVTDANSCSQTQTVSVTSPGTLSLTTSVTNVYCNGDATGKATAIASGGSSPYSYLWNDIPATNIATATGLTAGTYSVTITDNNGCTQTGSATITEPPVLTVTSSSTPASCNGTSDGTASVTASGGVSPYSYLWNNGQTSQNVTGLTAGNYSVTINGACTLSGLELITNGDFNSGNTGFSSSYTAVTSCPSGGFYGSGTIGDQYDVSQVTTCFGITDHNGGNGTALHFMDIQGANTGKIMWSETVTVSSNSSYVFSLWAFHGTAGCSYQASGGNFDIYINNILVKQDSVGGCNNWIYHQYSWPSDTSTTAIIEIRCGQGNFNLGIAGMDPLFDDLSFQECISCSVTSVITISQPDVLSSTIVSTDITCNGDSNGTAEAIAAGGILPYTYSWSNSNGIIGTTSQIFNLSASGGQIYTVTITDNNGCTTTQTVTLAQPAVLTIVANSTDVFCNGDSTGTAEGVAAGGISPYSYSWNDPASTMASTVANLPAGTYSVTATDSNFCSAFTTVIITEPDVLTATASASPVVCSNASVGICSAFATGGTPPYTYLWNNGAGTDSIQGISTGTYSVTITDDNGCAETAQCTVIINPVPSALFNADNICSYDSAQFTDATTINSGSFTRVWNFGDGNTSLLQNPTNLYNTSGSYNVTLTVTSDSGCVDSVSQFIFVNPAPNAIFTSNNVCHYDSSFFINSSTITNGNIITWIWDFGNGNSSFAQNPFYQYNIDGIHTITLIAISDSGCSDTVTSDITVYPASEAIFTANNVCIYDSAYFINTSTVTSGGITYSWDFGDGTTSSQQDPAHLFSTSGSYNVTLMTASDSGCTDSLSQIIFINPKPNAVFTSNNNCLYDTSFFNNTTNIISGNIAGWNWNFGDSTISLVANPYHIYSTAGIYTITLIALSDSGCTDTIINSIEKYPVPVPDFSPDTVCLNDSTQFTDLSLIADGFIASWAWNFGDGSPLVNQQNPYHYFALGSYYVTLIAISDKGCFDDLTKTVGVFPLPNAEFNYGQGCINEQPALFSDSSSVQGGTVSGWQWDFGDGEISAQQNPYHSYSSEGTFIVGLIVTSDKGCKDSLQKQIRIYPLPQVDFATSDTAGCLPWCLTFSESTTIAGDSISMLQWNLGNGDTSSIKNPAICYTSEGRYSVSLIATSDKGCKDTLTRNNYITVYPLPTADFTFSPQPATVQNMNILFSDNSSGDISQWNWVFYDNDSNTIKGFSDHQNPSFDFSTDQSNSFVFFLEDTGKYLVQLIVTTINGCRDTMSKNIFFDGVFLLNVPNAFTPNGDGKNDFFFPSGIGMDPFRNFNFFIFNRWGEFIFESHNLDQPWDGTVNGQTAQQDVYVWILEVQEATSQNKKHRYSGHVTLLK